MKNKFLIGLISGLFVVVMMFNLEINIQNNDNISLRNIAALSTANAEDTNVSCAIWYHGPECGILIDQNLNIWITHYSYAYYF